MVAIEAVRAASSSISSQSLIAVFVGATSGIGLAAIEALLKSTTSPKVFLVGRSKSTFAPTLTKIQNLNASAALIFVEAQVSLLKEVDRVCTIVKAQESAIDLLWVSQGGLSMSGHELTLEGLRTDLAVKYYSRTLFMYKLMLSLNRSLGPRIISIIAAGAEGALNITDFGLSGPNSYGFIVAAK